jgi:CubicO group peptidase (beta-lactamase class C family)
MGSKDGRSGDSPDDQSVYNVGSTFKIVTACAVAQLVTEGLLGWDVPINAYLPEIRRTDALGLSATLVDLSSNRTGLPMANCFWGQQNGEQLLPKTQFVHIVDDLEAVKPFGTNFIYSQRNYCLVQLIIERVTGKGFGDYIDEVIFEPLGLRSSTFDESRGSNIAKPHAIRDDGSATQVLTSSFDSVSGLAAGIGGKSNLNGQLTLYLALSKAYEHQVLHGVDTTPNSPFTQLGRIFTPHVSVPGSTLRK